MFLSTVTEWQFMYSAPEGGNPSKSGRMVCPSLPPGMLFFLCAGEVFYGRPVPTMQSLSALGYVLPFESAACTPDNSPPPERYSSLLMVSKTQPASSLVKGFTQTVQACYISPSPCINQECALEHVSIVLQPHIVG